MRVAVTGEISKRSAICVVGIPMMLNAIASTLICTGVLNRVGVSIVSTTSALTI